MIERTRVSQRQQEHRHATKGWGEHAPFQAFPGYISSSREENIRSEKGGKEERICMGVSGSACVQKWFIPDFPVIILIF